MKEEGEYSFRFAVRIKKAAAVERKGSRKD
jgi:hypothetical protein